MLDLVAHAREFAIAAHKNQRYGALPYVVHLDAVAELVTSYGNEAQIVAYLHDVVEDTHVSLDMVRAEFGDRIAKLVSLVTDEPGPSRVERKSLTNVKLSAVSDAEFVAIVVKTADRLANVRMSIAEGNSKTLAMYRGEHSQFRAAVHRPAMCEEWWHEIDSALGEAQTQ